MSPVMVVSAHIPVLVEEVVQALEVQPGGRYIDCTLGGGGHAKAILERSSPGGQLLGIDVDPEAIASARENLSSFSDSTLFINENFNNLEARGYKYDFIPVHGILFDLGLSSLQLSDSKRGFSFNYDAPLDMRFNPDQDLTAEDIVNTYGEVELANLIRKYGEERYNRRIARRIVKERPIKGTRHLARIIESSIGKKRGKIHPATRTFQALRIEVNHELENLESALKQAMNLLGFEGKLVVISYHSLEDRIVKQFMRRESRQCICPPGTPTCVCDHTPSLRMVNRRVVTPSVEEERINPRSRSAKLRVAERIMVQNEHYEVVERLCSETEINANGWRRPTLLKRLRRAFLTV